MALFIHDHDDLPMPDLRARAERLVIEIQPNPAANRPELQGTQAMRRTPARASDPDHTPRTR